MANRRDWMGDANLPGPPEGAVNMSRPYTGGWRTVWLNVLLIMMSVLFVVLMCELILFRFILIPSDVPVNVYMDGLVRLQPGSAGVWRVGDDVAGAFRINAQGWNSGHTSYDAKAPSGVRRIAIIGDSFVEALQVPYNESLAERLEGAGQGGLQVYRFGISGAPLSHYLAMARHVAQTYHPDMIVLVMVHNDFDESFISVAGRYTSSFLKFQMAGDRVVAEIPPAPYQATWRDWLRQSATLRYLYYRQRLNPAAVLTRLSPSSAPVYQANVDIGAVASQHEKISGATDYAFSQFQSLAREHNFRPLLMMDGDRRSIAAGMDDAGLYRDGALLLNAMAAQAASKAGLPFIDLHPLFREEWTMNHQPLNFISDNHWNALGHRVAAGALAAYIMGKKP